MADAERMTSWMGSPPGRWAAFYVRVTQEESVKTDLSIPNQVARAHEVAASRGWTDYQIYVEPRHVSGELWIDKRPGLRRLVEDIRAGRVSSVCSRHTDRLWRTAEVQSKLLPILRDHQVELWDYAHQHDYRSAHGRFSLQVLGAASELEVNLTAERIREMKRGKARKGKPGGGPPPYGYTSQSRRILELRAAGLAADEAYTKACLELPVGKCWYIDEREAEVVRLIFHFYTAVEHRFGSKRIAMRLNELGHRTRQGAAWLGNYVRRVVNNPAYAGFTSYDETAYEDRVASRQPRHRQALYPGEHPPIIEPDVWRQAQAIKSEDNTIKRTREGAKESRVFSLTGILRCPSCGSRMVGKWAHHSERTYYICARRHNGGAALCSFPLLNASQLHGEVWRWVHEVITSPQFVLDHVAELRKKLDADRPATEKRAAALHKRQGEIKAALGKYYGIFETSKDPVRDEALMERVRELRTELQAVEGEIEALRAKAAPVPMKLTEERVRAYLEKLAARVDERPEYQRAIFAEMKREHGLQVRPVTKSEVVVSMALPLRELGAEELAPVAAGAESRVYTVLPDRDVGRGPGGPGLPEPGGPSRSRLCPPAAATSRARRAGSSPRTSARS